MSEGPSAKPFDPNGGRKWMALWGLIAFAGLIFIGTYLKSAISALGDLDLGVQERVFIALSTIVGAFFGVNAYITGKTSEPPGTAPADQEVVQVNNDEPDEPAAD